MNRWFFVFLFTIVSTLHIQNCLAADSWYDKSNEPLLPTKIDKRILLYKDYSTFWWNFAVLEFSAEQEVSWPELKKICEEKLRPSSKSLMNSPCLPIEGRVQDLLLGWSEDYILRHPKPSDKALSDLYNQGLTKASFPLEKSILNLLRQDPFNSLEEYRNLLSQKVGFSFENHQGFFFDAQTKRVLIPLQFNHGPTNIEGVEEVRTQSAQICEVLRCQFAGVFGPHFSSWENESQTKKDVEVVSTVGIFILVVAGLLFAYLRRWRVFLLFLVMFPAMMISGAITALFFGKIHGLTLAFGPSISGLAIDYGLHGAFADEDDKEIWRANFLGLLTTLSIFILILLSQLPILRQLAVFSIFGLSISFLFLFLYKKYFSKYFHLKAFDFRLKPSKFMTTVSCALLVLAAGAPFLLKTDLSLYAMNFELASTSKIRHWLVSSGQLTPPLIQIQKQDSLLEKNWNEQQSWASQNNLKFEGAALYLPTSDQQQKNLETWSLYLKNEKLRSDQTNEFFEPYFKKIKSADRSTKDLAHDQSVPVYLQDLFSTGSWLTVWFPKSEEQKKIIQTKYPEASSVLEIMSAFSRAFAFDLSWMFPMAGLLAFSLLYFHFRSLKDCFLSIVPCLTGLGCFTAVYFASGMTMSFITLIGLIMMFSFSLDYGIFVVSAFREKTQNQDPLWTSIFFAASTNILGFAPLVFARHPALQHLGHSLFWGSLGAFIGTIWGVPVFYKYLHSEMKEL